MLKSEFQNTFSDWTGTDTFTYYANDETLDSDQPATVMITVTNETPTASILPDVYRWIEDRPDEVIALSSVFDDQDDPLSTLTYTVTVTGATGAVSASVDTSSQELTLTFGSTAGIAEVEIEATDLAGELVDTSFNVYVVEVPDMTIERQKPDGTWEDATGSILWSGDDLR